MTSSLQLREEIFPGYVLTERIGSGGYAEVWRARAPGGIDKAVKIVYGYYDDHLASQEMKALERIKGVRHPFVLSLERFEVVDGRLVILTELADMSLEQRAQQCRAQGLAGIPRDELLRYLADAAEALDYLAQRHSLQHLDIKPANLLVAGDHVKVADFGLVKELASRTQNSMVAGMTPTYSSPEMFDDAPSPHSDQYSLAIVFQELLTGVLPFPGRTAAQLANQQLRSQPQLTVLCQGDRPVVARALAKNPAQRFPSCRDFVKALLEAVDRAAPGNRSHESTGSRGHDDSARPVVTVPRTAHAGLPPGSPPSAPQAAHPTEVQPRGTVDTEAELKLAARLRPKEEIVDVVVPGATTAAQQAPPTLYLAVGGVGIRILCRLRDLLARRASNSLPSPAVEMLAIDTDPAELRDACASSWNNPLPAPDALCLPLRLPQEYRAQGQLDLGWLSHRWLYNIPRSLETRGYRPIGRLALVDHLDKALSLFDRKLNLLAAVHADDKDPREPPELRVVLIAGMGGGTGGGTAIDLANAVRSRVDALGRRGQVQGVFVCTCLGNARASPLSAANTYALLAELQFVSASGNQGTPAESGRATPLESPNRPFDQVYCLPLQHRGDTLGDHELDSIARQLSLASTAGVAQLLQDCRQAATPREQAEKEPLLLRTLGSASLAGLMQTQRDRLATHLARSMELQWLGDAGASEWRRLDCTGDAESALKNPALPSQAAESFQITAGSPRTHSQRWLQCFGKHASTRFACEVASRLHRQSALRGAYRSALLSSTNPARFLELALQALASICQRVANSPHLDRPLSDEDEVLIVKLASNSNRVLTKVIDELENLSAAAQFDAATMARIITSDCSAAVEEILGRSAADAANGSQTLRQADSQQTLDQANVDLLQCGYDRRTVLVVPRGNKPSEALDALTRSRPTAAVIFTDVDEPVILCEGAGISPSSLALGLERVFPGIAEAASRFFTRIDLDWSARPLQRNPTAGPPDGEKQRA